MTDVSKRRRVIEDQLIKLGFSMKLKGFQYLVVGLELLLDSGSFNNRYSSVIYAGVSDRLRIKPGAIEHGMRYAIEDAFNNGDSVQLFQMFPRKYYTTGRPTNLDFLNRLAREIFVSDLTF